VYCYTVLLSYIYEVSGVQDKHPWPENWPLRDRAQYVNNIRYRTTVQNTKRLVTQIRSKPLKDCTAQTKLTVRWY